ncbi:MAG TPA: outer membrane protein assembly factor BamA [Thermoanaerobaculia bacterium]|nr:outer membrane protein assembly factor BamA [Thermoanaerobaculia bacterium]
MGPRRPPINPCRRALAWALLPLILLAGAPPVAAQQTDGRIIRRVEFKGLKTLTPETLIYYLGIKVGEPLDLDRLNANLKQLWSRGLVDNIEVDDRPEGDGVRLVVTVDERPVLRSIDYQGLKRISKTDLQDKITSRRIRAHEGDPVSLGELQRIKSLIEEMYGEKGYRFAQAQYKVEDLTANEKRVVFTVDEGDQVRIGDIHFEGNHVFGNAHLRWVMKKTKQSGLITRILKKDVYNPASLAEDLDKVRDLYKGEGYKNIVIGDPKIEVKAMRPEAANPKDQKRRMLIIVPLEEGERWHFGEVTIEGNKLFSDQLLLKVFPHQSGAWLRSKLVDDGVKAIDDLYHNSGYIFARIEPELVERGNRVADVVVHVNEGDQYKVGRIEFEGNKLTLDKVLRREVRLEEGRLVSIGAVRNSITKINQLGYFRLDQEDPVKIDYNSQAKEVNLVFKGAEAARTQLEFGGGWSELDGFFGQFSISTKNFLGRGEQVGASIQTGKLRNLLDLSYTIPWFLDRPQSLGFRAYKQDLNYNLLDTQTYTTNSRGGIITYGRNVGLFDQVSLSYNRSAYQDTTQFLDVTQPTPTTTTTKTVYINSSSLKPAFAYNSLDNPFETTRGKKFSFSTEYAGGFLGGDAYFVRPEIGFSIFQPLTQHPARMILAFNTEGGVIIPFGGRAIPRLERFFLGGENSIRGFSFRSIFATDPKTGQPLLDTDGSIRGGDSYFQANLEYHFVLGGPFRILLYTDAGNVYAREQPFALRQLRYTAGVELRILVPVFGAPLRFIYAFNLDKHSGDQFQPFQFSIGTSF